jgi:integrase/recombinase XerD
MTTLLHERAEEYLRPRRALGFRLRLEGYRLPQFAGYLEQHGAAAVTSAHAIAWAQLPQGAHPVTWAHRLSAVRGLATWLRAIDPATEIPPKGVLPRPARRPARSSSPMTTSPGWSPPAAASARRCGPPPALPCPA